MEVPAGETLTVRARDWRGHTFFSKAVTVSEHGSFDAKIQLAKGVNGSATIWVGGQYHHIDVFEYEPATFKLRFTGRRQFAPGEAIEIPNDWYSGFARNGNLQPNSPYPRMLS